jgi:hypothetical protein
MQLLRITSIPLKYTVKTESPRLELQQPRPHIDMDRRSAQLRLRSKNIQVRLDTYEARSSLGLKSVFDARKESAQKGLEAVSKAAAQYTEMGNMMAKIYDGVRIPDIMYDRLFKQPTTSMIFLPSVGPQISWSENKLDVDYDAGYLKMDTNYRPVDMRYVPGDISIEIQQYNKLEIDYLGEPNYVPPSARPDYIKKEG